MKPQGRKCKNCGEPFVRGVRLTDLETGLTMLGGWCPDCYDLEGSSDGADEIAEQDFVRQLHRLEPEEEEVPT